ncbi:ribosylnicotinamide kinase [Ceratobasidium sp. 392]|nr:ribosylnicotinamide kinase [Ceratobasidium sp. 392]
MSGSGASSSGKSSLTALLKDIIPGCTVLHQDDFWTPLEEAPIHPVHGIPDPEGPPGAIDWPRFKEAFKRFRSTQPFVDNHPKSSESTPSPSSSLVLPDGSPDEWRSRFKQVEKERMHQGIKIEWRIVEGFLLYYDLASNFRTSAGLVLTERSFRKS